MKNLGDPLNGEKSQLALIDLSEKQVFYTYAELDAQIEAQAEALGIGRSYCIGLLAANSAAFVLTFFAIIRRGSVAVPINTKFAKDTLAYISQDTELKFTFVDSQQANKLPRKLILRELTTSFAGAITPEVGRPSLVLYTSGPTGMPIANGTAEYSSLHVICQAKGCE